MGPFQTIFFVKFAASISTTTKENKNECFYWYQA